jgi:tetratricopeptide (TPR) repeat protein
MTLNNLGNVQRALGEREAARKSFHGALEIYRRLAAQHPAAFEPNVAMTLNNLGTVQSDLGEREAARECYAEALGIYAPLAEKYPRAFVHNLRIVLRGYTSVTPESEDDPWWRLWRELTRQPEDAPT